MRVRTHMYMQQGAGRGAGRGAVDSEPYTVLESVVTQIQSTVDPRLSEPLGQKEKFWVRISEKFR